MSELPLPPRRRKLGRSDIEVSSMAWGNWRLCGGDVAATIGLVQAMIDADITLLDTADIYGPDNSEAFGASEQLLGQAFAAQPGLRDQVVLASKGGIEMGTPYNSSEAYITSAIDASLTRLQTDRLDLWQIHRPDILTHPAEIARAIDKAFSAGKIRGFGVSNFTTTQITTLQQFLDLPILTTQPEFSPLQLTPLEDGSLDQAIAMDLAVMAWSPLGGGRIANPAEPRDLAVAAALDTVAQQAGVSRTAAAYSWIMAHPAGAIPIIGSQRADRLKQARDAFKVRWTRQQWYAVLVASKGEDLP